MMLARRLLLLCVLAAGLSTPALAAGKKEEAKAEFEKAEMNYKLGRFQEALEAYTRAYEIFPAAALLFDIGQCHRNLGHYDRAVFFFEGYLREENNPSRRRLAQQLLAESRAELQKQRAAAAAHPPETPAPPPPQPAAPAPSPPTPLPPPSAVSAPSLAAVEPASERPTAAPALVASAPAADEAPTTPVTHRWWFWTAIGAGALAIAAGAFAYSSSGGTTSVLPGGSVGTLDRR